MIVSARNLRARSDIALHRSTLTQSEITYVRGTPVTSVARTICDLAATEPTAELEQLLVEVDGRRFHGHAAAFENDRRRDQILVAAGYRVIRVTWRQLTREPMAVAVRLAQALAWAEAA